MGVRSVAIPRALAPQERLEVQIDLEFFIRYPSATHTGAKPYEVVDHPNIQLFCPSIERYVPSAHAYPPQTFIIRYPLQL